MAKTTTTNEDAFCEYSELLNNEFMHRIAKNTYDKRMVVFFDNASFHKKEES